MGLLPLPSEIAGVKIPQITTEDLTDFEKLKHLAGGIVVNAGAHALGLDGVVDASEDVQVVIHKSATAVCTSCKVLSAGADSISSIQVAMEPIMPLFRAKNDPIGAFEVLTMENLSACIKVIEHVLSLGNLMDTTGKMLHEVQQAFEQLSNSAQPIAEKVKEVLKEVAEQFESALNLKEDLNGIENFFEELTELVKDLGSMSSTLDPILKACEEHHFGSVAHFGAERWEKVIDALQHFMPAWEKTQTLYNVSQNFNTKALDKTGTAWNTFVSLVQQVCDHIHVNVPEWLNAGANPLKDVVAPPKLEIKQTPAEDKTELFTPCAGRNPMRACCILMTLMGGGRRARQMQASSAN